MTLEEAKEIVFSHKQGLRKLYDTYGNKTWADYASDRYPKSSHLSHTEELFTSLRSLLVPLIGEDKAKKTELSLQKNGFVSTTDHHGILHHPFFYNASLVRGVLSPHDTIVCLSCGNISPTNSSYPRGISFRDDNHNIQKISFISLRNRRRPLFGLRAFSRETLETNKDKIQSLHLATEKKHSLISWIEKIERNKNIFTAPHISDQFTIMNDILWEEIQGSTCGNLVYLEIESLIRQILLDIHINEDTLIHKILFNSHTRNTYINSFKDVAGAHSHKTGRGTDLFWYIDKLHNVRIQLSLVDNNLVSNDHSIRIPLHTNVIRDHLMRFELVPSMALCYSILAFYYGLTLGGGFCQIDYLGDMKRAWKQVADSAGEPFTDTETNVFTGEFALFTDNTNYPITLFDLYLHKDTADLSQIINETPIKKTLDSMMPEFVEIVTGKREKIDDIS